MDPILTHQVVETSGTKLHAVTAGEGFPVVLLHGFRQSWYEWRNVIPVLARDFRGALARGQHARDDTGHIVGPWGE